MVIKADLITSTQVEHTHTEHLHLTLLQSHCESDVGATLMQTFAISLIRAITA